MDEPRSDRHADGGRPRPWGSAPHVAPIQAEATLNEISCRAGAIHSEPKQHEQKDKMGPVEDAQMRYRKTAQW